MGILLFGSAWEFIDLNTNSENQFMIYTLMCFCAGGQSLNVGYNFC